MLTLRGHASLVKGFEATRTSCILRLREPDGLPSDLADIALARCKEDLEAAIACGFSGAVVVAEDADAIPQNAELSQAIVLSSRFSYLGPGDILSLRPAQNRVSVLFRRNSQHNSFLVTERCNHYCLMCSQPPRDVDDSWLLDEIRDCLPLIAKETRSLGFTGGEPLLDWKRFIQVLNDCRKFLPTTAVHVLSNGRAFANTEVVAAWAGIGHPNLTVGIPIYADVDCVHDYIVQASGAFDETVLGILKLKDRGQRVEVRVVLHAVNTPRLVETCRWLARNLPFLDHVALMGLENTGFAIANEHLLWIDPLDYQEALAEGVQVLSSAGVRVSVYNLPLCILAPSVWPYAVQSISDWKNGYVEACNRCIAKPECSGQFTSGRPRISRGVAPILPGDPRGVVLGLRDSPIVDADLVPRRNSIHAAAGLLS